jgi:hypothetical protein
MCRSVVPVLNRPGIAKQLIEAVQCCALNTVKIPKRLRGNSRCNLGMEFCRSLLVGKTRRPYSLSPTFKKFEAEKRGIWLLVAFQMLSPRLRLIHSRHGMPLVLTAPGRILGLLCCRRSVTYPPKLLRTSRTSFCPASHNLSLVRFENIPAVSCLKMLPDSELAPRSRMLS